MVNEKTLEIISDAPIFWVRAWYSSWFILCALVWTPPWVVLLRRLFDLKQLRIPLLMDAGSGAMGCASLQVLTTLGIALNTLLSGTGTW
jgi:hypothetical protein